MNKLLTFLVLSSCIIGTTSAGVLVLPHDPAREGQTDLSPAHREIRSKVDMPQRLLVLPFYEVDNTSGTGTTTLFAVRSLASVPVLVEIVYLDPRGEVLVQDSEILEARQTLSINLRDVAGVSGGEGISRGYVVIGARQAPGGNSGLADDGRTDPRQPDSGKGVVTPTITLAGDFFQVDIGGAFATGERLLTLADICLKHEVRFLDFGSGASMRLFVNDPLGDDPEMSLPSVTVTPITEDGTVLPAVDVFTDEVSFELPASSFTEETFGTLIFDFSNSSGGWVYAEYSADGLFSVGLNSACTVPLS